MSGMVGARIHRARDEESPFGDLPPYSYDYDADFARVRDSAEAASKTDVPPMARPMTSTIVPAMKLFLMALDFVGTFVMVSARRPSEESDPEPVSVEDFSVAMLDELERPAHSRQHFMVAY